MGFTAPYFIKLNIFQIFFIDITPRQHLEHFAAYPRIEHKDDNKNKDSQNTNPCNVLINMVSTLFKCVLLK